MAEREPSGWFTMNGRRIPIFEGESKADAVNRAVAKANADTKNRQIAENQKQSSKAQKPYRPNPKNLALKDIDAKDANKTSDVLSLETGKRYAFKDGTKITQVEVFAGKGAKREFRKAEKYAKRYPQSGKNPSDWQHCSGKAIITDGKKDYTREVHWVQGADGKMREAFIKRYKGKLEKRK